MNNERLRKIENKLHELTECEVKLVYSDLDFIEKNFEEIRELLTSENPATILKDLSKLKKMDKIMITKLEGENINSTYNKNYVYLYGRREWTFILNSSYKRVEIYKIV